MDDPLFHPLLTQIIESALSSAGESCDLLSLPVSTHLSKKMPKRPFKKITFVPNY